MKSIVRPKRSRRSLSRLITCAWIDTSSADTGSSATMKLRLDRERPGDADALALPARELVRIAARVLGREADQREQLGDPRRARRRPGAGRAWRAPRRACRRRAGAG